LSLYLQRGLLRLCYLNLYKRPSMIMMDVNVTSVGVLKPETPFLRLGEVIYEWYERRSAQQDEAGA